MAEECRGCGKDIEVNGKIMGVFGARKPSYGAPVTVWSELYDGRIIFVYHPECLQNIWETQVGETLPEATTHSRNIN